ncbi:hypothetical protein ACFPYI_05650 [Halomarina salina]|uniref:Sulfatase n=1 Tax=Halomarina salina TaxID=1872699 RepID=A0ABD5RKH4_9EURY|nr:hypothetical protein [Halomarina salina]
MRPSDDGDPVLDADWDLLIVLDACRADLFETVVGEGDYEGLDVGEVRRSPGSSSDEWLASVFGEADDEALDSLAYVTGNPYTADLLDESRFGHLEEVWYDGWDDDLGTVPPRAVTDRAIRVGRRRSPERMIVHYMQPHFPSLTVPDDEGVTLAEFGDRPMSIWNDIRIGRRDVGSVRESYRTNLELVLEEVQALRSNVDADRAVITADHGNAFGERYLYGHPAGVDLPCLREVPWCETTATDRGTRLMDAEAGAASATATRAESAITDGGPEESEGPTASEEELVNDRLRSLGYRP